MPKKRGTRKGKARLIANPAEETVVGSSPIPIPISHYELIMSNKKKSYPESTDDSSENANKSPSLKKYKISNDPNKCKSLIPPIKLDVLNETSSKGECQGTGALMGSSSSNTSFFFFGNEHLKTQNTPVKRSLPEAEEKDVKRRKFQVKFLTESGPSVPSRVEDWLDHSEVNHFEQSNTIHNLMERIDTAFNENTSKTFVHLFVEAQRRLGAITAEQREMLRQAATKITNSLADVISELDQRSQRVQDEFMENLKQQAFAFIKDDYKQKRDMTRLLQEDVQNAFELMQKTYK